MVLRTNCSGKFCILETSVFEFHFFKQLLLENCEVDFVEIYNICPRKVIIKDAKRIFHSDKICRIYCAFYYGVLIVDCASMAASHVSARCQFLLVFAGFRSVLLMIVTLTCSD